MNTLLIKSVNTGISLEMIYMDSKGNLSQRQIRVLEINDNSIKAFCYSKNQRRTFKMEQILSILPVYNHNRKIG